MNIEVYIDKMVVMSDSFHWHVENLKEAFYEIQKYNMRLNLKKIRFCVPQLYANIEGYKKILINGKRW